MAGMVTDTVRLGSGLTKFTWSGSAPFDVYGEDGEALLSNTSLTELIVSHPDTPNAAPMIEVQDATAAAPPQFVLWPGTVALQWRRRLGALAYRVEQWNGAEWVAVSPTPIYADPLRGYFQWRSRVLPDMATAQFRVVVLDAAGNESAADSTSCFIARVPSAPAVTVAWNSSTNEVEVS